MKFSSQKSAAFLVAISLLSGATSAVAADSDITEGKAAATKRASEISTFHTQMNTYIAAARTIRDSHRASIEKALADFQTALAAATTQTEMKAAKDAHKSARQAADAVAKSALDALAKPTKPAKPIKVSKPAKQVEPTA